jgi:DNA-binding response OmpR family regulator
MPHSLLLVHANSDDREMYAEYLSSQGFRVITTNTTDGALPLIGPADVIITGLLVPGSFDGVDLIERVRQNPRTALKPVIVVTATTFSHQVERARRAGANVILLKPCLPNVLAAEVRQVLERGISAAAAGKPPLPDRRQIPDRRAQWRGGRRDSDWIGHPRTASNQ